MGVSNGRSDCCYLFKRHRSNCTWDSFQVLANPVAETSHPASGSYIDARTHLYIYLGSLSLSLYFSTWKRRDFSCCLSSLFIASVTTTHRMYRHLPFPNRIRSPSSAPPHSIPPILYTQTSTGFSCIFIFVSFDSNRQTAELFTKEKILPFLLQKNQNGEGIPRHFQLR